MTEITQDATPLEIPQAVFGFRTGCRIFMHLVSQYEVRGRHNIPRGTSYMIISNHLSLFDAPAFGGAMIENIPGFAAKKHRASWIGRILALGSPIWVEQDAPDRKAITHAVRLIKAGNPFVLSVEGTRSKTGGLIQGKEGAAFLVNRTHIPILPMAVWGSEDVFHKVRPKVQVVIGKTFRLPEGRARTDLLSGYTERMMCAIAALLPEEYHGIYKGNPLIEEMAQLVCE